MNPIEALLLVLVVQQCLLAAGWWAAGRRLRLSSEPAKHWSLFSGMSGLAALCPLLPLQWPPVWLVGMAASAVVVALLALSRGLDLFFKQPTRDRQYRLVGAISAAIILLPALWPQSLAWNQQVLAALLGVVAVRAARPALIHTSREFGDPIAWLLALPLLGGGLALAVLWSGLRPELDLNVGLTPADSLINRALMLAMMAACLMFVMMLAYLVMMRLVQRLRYLSSHDALTGLLNRRALEERLVRELKIFRRSHRSFAILLLDVDHFKRINDTWGHKAGDRALTQLARVLQATVREVDEVGRFGGEEFCALIRGADAAGAREAAERIRLAAMAIKPAPRAEDMTISIGVMAVDAPQWGQFNISQLLDRADRALYRAKHSGRNRVEMFSPTWSSESGQESELLRAGPASQSPVMSH
jgi:diguanylate cyclase (GGDEF)-like protein